MEHALNLTRFVQIRVILRFAVIDTSFVSHDWLVLILEP